MVSLPDHRHGTTRAGDGRRVVTGAQAGGRRARTDGRSRSTVDRWRDHAGRYA